MVLTVSACLFGVLLTSAGWACTSSEIDVSGNGSQCEVSKFQLTTTNLGANGSFNFWMSAKGTFYVDCGDGGTLSGTNASGKTISKTTNITIQYSCSWSSAGAHTIKFGGVATEYASVGLDMSSTNAAIQFGVSSNQAKIASVSGSLGELFPQLGSDENQIPRFLSTFDGASNLTSVSSNLFSGLTGGVNAKYMFYETFTDCTSLTSIPEGLFKDVTVASNSMFYKTFANCSNLTGYIAPTTFAGLTANSSPTATSMWYNTFDSTQLATACPSGLPQYITGYEGNANSTSWNGKVSCGCMPGYAVSGGVCTACDNKPAHSYYVYNPSADSCPWQCDDNYTNVDGMCALHCINEDFYDSALDACTPCPSGYTYNQNDYKTDVTQCQISCSAGTVVKTAGVYGFTRLEYLESDGTAYINTGFKHSATATNIRGEIRIGTPENSTIDKNVNFLGNQVNKEGYSVGWAPSTFKVWVDKSGNRLNSSDTNEHVLQPNTVYDIEFELTPTMRYLTYNGVRVEKEHAGGIITTRNIHLFDNGKQQMDQVFIGRIYYMRLYEDDVLVHNFVPVQLTGTETVGIYDTVTGRFFTKAEGNEFAYGQALSSICEDVGPGHYAAAQVVNFGDVGTIGSCPVGQYSTAVNAADASVCQNCTGATYADTEGSGACTPCPTGFDNDATPAKTSANQCKTQCAPGTYLDLPGIYTQLEYIASSGTQYINTGINVSTLVNPVVTLTAQYTQVQNNKKTGATANSNNFSIGIDNSGNFACVAGTDATVMGRANTQKHTFIMDVANGTCKMDETASALTVGTISNINKSIYIGGVNGASGQIGKARYYGFNLVSNGNVVMNLVPARRNDGVLGMYDTINGRFLLDAVATPLTAGPVVTRSFCKDVGAGYWGAGGAVAYNQRSTRTACPVDLTTPGYGHGADEAADCGRELHVGDTFIYTKMTKPTTPAINIQMSENDIYYIGLSPTNQNLSKLHLMYNGQQYTAYDDSLLYGERDPATGNKITQ